MLRLLWSLKGRPSGLAGEERERLVVAEPVDREIPPVAGEDHLLALDQDQALLERLLQLLADGKEALVGSVDGRGRDLVDGVLVPLQCPAHIRRITSPTPWRCEGRRVWQVTPPKWRVNVSSSVSISTSMSSRATRTPLTI